MQFSPLEERLVELSEAGDAALGLLERHVRGAVGLATPALQQRNLDAVDLSVFGEKNLQLVVRHLVR